MGNLNDIANPLTDLAAVKRNVKGLLDVCKNGAPGACAAGRLSGCARCQAGRPRHALLRPARH